MSRAKLFGLPPDADRAAIKRLLACCDEASEDELAAGPARDTGWVVHSAAVDAFRAARVGNDLHAVIWLPASGEPQPPEDWWSDFHAVLREGSDEDARTLANFSRCPVSLDLTEDVEDIDEGWFLTLTDNPAHRLVLEQLPDWFLDKYAGVLGSSPEARDELMAALGFRAGQIWQGLLPDTEEIAAWLTGDADSVVEDLARRCPMLQKLIREQGHLWLDADLIDEVALHAKLASVGLVVSGPRRQSPVPEPSRPLTRWVVHVAEATREVWETAASFAAAVVAGLISQAALSPAVSLSRGRSDGIGPGPRADAQAARRPDPGRVPPREPVHPPADRRPVAEDYGHAPGRERGDPRPAVARRTAPPGRLPAGLRAGRTPSRGGGRRGPDRKGDPVRRRPPPCGRGGGDCDRPRLTPGGTRITDGPPRHTRRPRPADYLARHRVWGPSPPRSGSSRPPPRADRPRGGLDCVHP